MANYASFIWSVADILRGSYKAHQYGGIVLPFTVLRRLDSVLATNKAEVLAVVKEAKANGLNVSPGMLRKRANHQYSFYNTSRWSFENLLNDPNNIKANLTDYVTGFSDSVRDIFDKYEFEKIIDKLDENDLLYLVVQKFQEVDLSPQKVNNTAMGHVFEELIRKFAEASNETAGEHFTPREVIELMVDILLSPDKQEIENTPHISRSIYDPTAGTGGMLSVAEDHIKAINSTASLKLAGQELNPESYAICKADMVIKGQDIQAIVNGDTLVNDGHAGTQFNYCLSNPPFGVDWKKAQKTVEAEHKERGFAGRFGPGTPRVSDGSMLFLLHLISKMRDHTDQTNGGRAAIVLNGSPLFTGGAGSGESEIRKWILERDYLEAIIALPTDMFYNTGIATYVWVLSKNKSAERRNKVQLIDGSGFFEKMRKSLGSKRNQLGTKDIERIVELYEQFEHEGKSKIFNTTDFFYRTITVERPLRLNFSGSPERVEAALQAKPILKLSDESVASLRTALLSLGDAVRLERKAFQKELTAALKAEGVALAAPAMKAMLAALSERDENAEVCVDAKGRPEPDTDARDTENVPWGEDVHEYLEREVKPFVPDAWIDQTKTKEGCEIPFTRHFYEYVPPRSLEEIDADLDEVLGRIRARLEQVKA